MSFWRKRKLGLIAVALWVGCASGKGADDGAGGTSGSGSGGSSGIGSGGTGGLFGSGGSVGTGGVSGSGGSGGTSGASGNGGAAGEMPDAAIPDASIDAAPVACTPRAAVCDPVCNVGCPAGQRCDLSPTPNQGMCISTTGETGQPGQICMASPTSDSCLAREACLGSATAGTCYRMCYVDTDCQPGACCDLSITLGTAQSGFNACGISGTCDPTATNGGGCASGNACYILPCTTSTANVECACNTASSCGTTALTFNKTNGQPCTYVNECASGYTCVGQPSVCRGICRLGSNAGCPAANPTCTALQISPGPPPLNSTVYGVCL